MKQNQNLFIGIFIGAVSVILINLLISDKQQIPEVITQTVTDTVTVINVKTDTVRVTVRDSIFIEEYVPIITDSIASLDTMFVAIDNDTLGIIVELGVKFDLKDRLFRDLYLGFPYVTFPVDTVYSERLILKEKIIQIKPPFWKYAEAGVVGAAIGAVAYALIQGL